MSDKREVNRVGYTYNVDLKVDVRRIDNSMLTDEENKMVHEMHDRAGEAVAAVMEKYGQARRKELSKKTNIY